MFGWLVSQLIDVCFVSVIEKMPSNSSKDDNELQLLRKQLSEEKLKKEQVRQPMFNCLVISLCLCICLSVNNIITLSHTYV